MDFKHENNVLMIEGSASTLVFVLDKFLLPSFDFDLEFDLSMNFTASGDFSIMTD